MVQDWAGGTRIGHALSEFNRVWSRRVLGQGAVVLLISDGLDRDAGQGLAVEMERLHKSCRRLIWLNPLLRYDQYAPDLRRRPGDDPPRRRPAHGAQPGEPARAHGGAEPRAAAAGGGGIGVGDGSAVAHEPLDPTLPTPLHTVARPPGVCSCRTSSLCASCRRCPPVRSALCRMPVPIKSGNDTVARARAHAPVSPEFLADVLARIDAAAAARTPEQNAPDRRDPG